MAVSFWHALGRVACFMLGAGVVVASAMLPGCGSDEVTPPNVDEAGEPAPLPCGAVEQIPATLVVTTVSGAALPCDATFTIAAANGAQTILCGNVGNPCEAATVDAGLNACPYSVNVGGGASTVVVSQAGFESVSVPNVTEGVAGCVANPVAATQASVTLVPLVDAGGGPGDARVGGAEASDQ